MPAFQSTLPRGSDIRRPGVFIKLAISIHAPSRERLAVYLNSSILLAISIHAPSRERRYGASLIGYSTLFQSTLPRGSDVFTGNSWLECVDFNPRSLAGATKIKQQGIFHSGHFNPRSLAGATLTSPRIVAERKHFNPRSLAGATIISCLLQFLLPYFNPRSLAGATWWNTRKE